MGESFQDYSWIQDFEADFPKLSPMKPFFETQAVQQKMEIKILWLESWIITKGYKQSIT